MSLAEEFENDFLSDEDEGLQTIKEEDEEAIDDMLMDEDSKEGIKRSLSDEDIIVRELSDVKKLARLGTSGTLDDVLKKIEEYGTTVSTQSRFGLLDNDPEYKLVVQANSLSAELDQEIILVNKFIKDRYRLKFPELETLIRNPLDYAKTVRLIGNNMNIIAIDFSQILPSASIMVVKTAATTTKGKPLNDKELAIVLKACDMALDLDAAKRKIFDFVQSRVPLFAPNLCAFIGTRTASQLIGATGGLANLAATPSTNLQAYGMKRALGTGMALNWSEGSRGYIWQSDLIQRIAPDYRKQAQRRVSGKMVLLARIDQQRESTDGLTGKKWRGDFDKAMRKIMTPPESRGPRALPAPLDVPSKKRGGKRVRKAKEKNAMTDMRKLQNRVKFGEAEAEVEYGDESEGLGMLTQAGNFRALTVDNRTKAKVGKKTQAQLASIGGSKTSLRKESSGLQSSLSFTPLQGIELVNPSLNDAAREALVKSANDKWFASGTFTQIRKEPSKMLPPTLPTKK
jgi:U4/U6 small nuclear ribonucleoprotein PRP31